MSLFKYVLFGTIQIFLKMIRKFGKSNKLAWNCKWLECASLLIHKWYGKVHCVIWGTLGIGTLQFQHDANKIQYWFICPSERFKSEWINKHHLKRFIMFKLLQTLGALVNKHQFCLHTKTPHVVTMMWLDSDWGDYSFTISGTSGKQQNQVYVPPWFLHSDSGYQLLNFFPCGNCAFIWL